MKKWTKYILNMMKEEKLYASLGGSVVLSQDEEATVLRRKEKSDPRELKCLCAKFRDYILKHCQDSELASREQLMKASEIASILFEVLKTVTSGVGPESLSDGEDIEVNFVPYNILPLGTGGVNHAIMQLPEIKDAVAAVRNICGMPLIETGQKLGVSVDLLDWLQSLFGFQKGNVDNQ